jgi:hypothetical protein
LLQMFGGAPSRGQACVGKLLLSKIFGPFAASEFYVCGHSLVNKFKPELDLHLTSLLY